MQFTLHFSFSLVFWVVRMCQLNTGILWELVVVIATGLQFQKTVQWRSAISESTSCSIEYRLADQSMCFLKESKNDSGNEENSMTLFSQFYMTNKFLVVLRVINLASCYTYQALSIRSNHIGQQQRQVGSPIAPISHEINVNEIYCAAVLDITVSKDSDG